MVLGIGESRAIVPSASRVSGMAHIYFFRELAVALIKSAIVRSSAMTGRL